MDEKPVKILCPKCDAVIGEGGYGEEVREGFHVCGPISGEALGARIKELRASVDRLTALLEGEEAEDFGESHYHFTG